MPKKLESFSTNELGGLREVLEFATSPCWKKDTEALANGQGTQVFGLCLAKGLIVRTDIGYRTSAAGFEVVTYIQFGTGQAPLFTPSQAEVIRSTFA